MYPLAIDKRDVACTGRREHDGVNFDRMPRPEERSSLLAYLRKL
jgi:hypothetical protein